MVVMKKRIAVCFILLCYAVTACGSLLEMDCCHDDQGQTNGGHASQRHVPSKSQVAAHLLFHAQEVPDLAKLTHGQCCCVSLSSEEAGQPPHAPGRQSAVSDPKVNSYKILAASILPLLQALCLSGSPSIPLDSFHCHLLTFRSISSTILLI